LPGKAKFASSARLRIATRGNGICGHNFFAEFVYDMAVGSQE